MLESEHFSRSSSPLPDTIETQFPDIAEGQPDLLAWHYTEAGLIDMAAGLWGKAGLQWLERSAFLEAIEQLTRALNQIATLPSTPALRREEIRLQVAVCVRCRVLGAFEAC